MPDSKPKNGMRLITTLMGTQTAILLAGIPWAFNVHGTVSAIKEKVGMLPQHTEYSDLLQRVSRLEAKHEDGS